MEAHRDRHGLRMRTRDVMSAAEEPRGEFELIARYFTLRGSPRKDVLLGVGDDGALLSVPARSEVICASATGPFIHEFDGTMDRAASTEAPASTPEPGALVAWLCASAAYDLERAGARARWATLALTLPHAQSEWLGAFSQALDRALRAAGVALVGGDTTRGPLSVTLTLTGLRSVEVGARPPSA